METSIVLVIVGLIAGVVLVGQDLIKAAEIRAAVKQLQTIQAAVNTFQSKYDCLPGDCPDASSYGLMTGYVVDYQPIANGATGDGNGDGLIGPLVQDSGEWYTFWLELRNSQLINYPGYKPCYFTGGPPFAVESKAESAVIMPYSNPEFPMNFLRITSYDQWCSYPPEVFGLSSAAAYGIDAKIDDGYPDTDAIDPTSIFATPNINNLVQATGWMWFDGGSCLTCAYYFYPVKASDGTECVDDTVTPNQYNLANKNPNICSLLVALK